MWTHEIARNWDERFYCLRFHETYRFLITEISANQKHSILFQNVAWIFSRWLLNVPNNNFSVTYHIPSHCFNFSVSVINFWFTTKIMHSMNIRNDETLLSKHTWFFGQSDCCSCNRRRFFGCNRWSCLWCCLWSSILSGDHCRCIQLGDSI